MFNLSVYIYILTDFEFSLASNPVTRKFFLSIIIQQACQKEEAAELKSLLICPTCNTDDQIELFMFFLGPASAPCSEDVLGPHLQQKLSRTSTRNRTLKQKMNRSQCQSSDCSSTVRSLLVFRFDTSVTSAWLNVTSSGSINVLLLT